MEWKWVNGRQLFSPSPGNEAVPHDAAPGSIPVEWRKRSDLLEWKNPWYSHGLEAPDGRTDPSIFCSELPPPQTAPASCESAADDDDRECHDPETRCNGRRSGQAWTVAICALRGCRDAHGLEASLDFLGKVVLGLLHSELAQAFDEFDKAIQTKKRELGMRAFNPPVERLVVSVAANFKQEMTACLPLHVLQFALEFVDLTENGVLCAVSKEFREAAQGDPLWREAYENRFPKKDEGKGNASQGGPDGCAGGQGQGDVAATASTLTLANGKELSVDAQHAQRGSFKHLYKSRLQDPHVGDRVEVAWKGKFRLESFEVYDGTAWWLAEVVDKGDRPGYYRVHYPGWEDKWDEWVPRNRLRWGNERLAAALEGIAPRKGDSVEMWCQGLHVPGAWLEAVVHGVEKGRLYLGEVLTSGHFWVDAEHVRLIKQGRVDQANDGGEDPQEAYGDMSAYRSSSLLLQALSEAGFTGSTHTGCCCSLM